MDRLTKGELDGLRAHLSDALGCDVAFSEEPTLFSRGLTSDVYSMRLAGSLPSEWSGPLVLRVTRTRQLGVSTLTREQQVQRFVSERGYPAARVLLVETSGDVLGHAFAVLQRAPGGPMQRTAFRNPVTAYRLATVFADSHAALHRLRVDGFPASSERPAVDRQLDAKRDWLGDSADVRGAFAWLETNKQAVLPEEPAICHGNFQPGNVLVDDEGAVTVIDWGDADLGDRHADLADALVMLRTSPVPGGGVRAMRWRFARSLFARRYLSRYQQQLVVDKRRLAYWGALMSFVWMRNVAVVVLAEPTRLDAEDQVYERQQANLCRYFRRCKLEFERLADRVAEGRR